MSERTRLYLIIILTLSVLARLGTALFLGDEVMFMPGTADQVSYHTLATQVLAGRGFTFPEQWWPATAAGAPTAHWSYLYTLYLIGVYAVFGAHPLAATLIQGLVVGLLHPWLAYRLGREVFGETVGLFAAGLTAIYAYFVYYAGTLMTESFYITAILAALILAARLAKQPDLPPRRAVWPSLGLGAALAAAVLLRQAFLLFIPFIFAWIIWARRTQDENLLAGLRRGLFPLAAASAVIVLAIAPFTVFNYLRFNRFVLLNTNAGFAFFWGNHPIYGTTFIPILPPEMGSYQDLIPQDLMSLDEAALDSALLRLGIGFVTADPWRYIQLSISRIPAYFMFWTSDDSSLLSNISRAASFGLLWPLMAFGLLRALVHRSPVYRFGLRSPVMLFYMFVVIYSGIHILTWALIRYRLPVDAVLLIFAALVLVEAFQWLGWLRRLGLGAELEAGGQAP